MKSIPDEICIVFGKCHNTITSRIYYWYLGEWGTGKTTLMKKIAYVLENPKNIENPRKILKMKKK